MIIVVDLDDVIAEFVPHLLRFLNEEYGSNLKFENIKGWNIWEYGDITEEQYREGIEKFMEAGMYRNLPLIEGAREGLKVISEHHDVYIVTWRSLKIREDTEYWLEKNLGNAYKEVYFSDNKPKLGILKKLNAELFIDDSPTHTRDAVKICRTLLYTKPWNENIIGIERVSSWEEILEKI